jgi:hypothetical protein
MRRIALMILMFDLATPAFAQDPVKILVDHLDLEKYTYDLQRQGFSSSRNFSPSGKLESIL